MNIVTESGVNPDGIWLVGDYDSTLSLAYTRAQLLDISRIEKTTSEWGDIKNLPDWLGDNSVVYAEYQHMPVMISGFTLARSIRELGYRGGLVLALNWWPDLLPIMNQEQGNPADLIFRTPLTMEVFKEAIVKAHALHKNR